MRSALIAALLLLGGCNMVVTPTPMVSKTDEAGAPSLRPGVWRGKADPACAFDEQSSLDGWPSCANGAVVGDNDISVYQTLNGQRAPKSKVAYILAAGDPRVLQISLSGLTTGVGLSFNGYVYGGLRQTKTDAEGRIIAYSAWLVACGPSPPQNTKSSDGAKISFGTLAPFSGLVMDKDGQNCAPKSVAALRNATVESEKLPDATPSSSHWVRDGDR